MWFRGGDREMQLGVQKGEGFLWLRLTGMVVCPLIELTGIRVAPIGVTRS